MEATPAQPRTLPPAWLQLAGIAGIGVLLWVVYGPGYVGIDGMWSLVWGNDLAHLSTLTTSGTTTPHVLSNLLGLALSPFGSGADRGLVVVEYLGASALVWAVGLLAREVAGTPAGVAAALLMASREQLLYATRSAFLDVLAAALVAWAVLALVRWRGERLRGVAVLLALAGLLRPEPWVLLGVVAVFGWRKCGGRIDPVLVALVVAVPVLWAVADLVLSGDALFSLHETQRVSDLFRAGQHIPTGLKERIVSVPRNLGHAPGPELLVLGIAAGALVLWPGARGSALRTRAFGAVLTPRALEQLRLATGAALVLAAVIALEALSGTLLFARFGLQFSAPLVAVVAAVLALVAQAHLGGRAVPALAVATLLLLIVAGPFLHSARTTTDPEHARYEAARAAIAPGVPCTPVVVPGINFRAFAAVWAGVRGNAVIAAATRGVPPTGTFVDATAADAQQLLLDPSFPQQRLADPTTTLVRTHDGWILRSRCAG